MAEEEKKDAAPATEDTRTPEQIQADEAAAAAKKAKKKKMIILGALVGLLVLGGGGYFVAKMMGGSHETHSDVELGPDGKPIEKTVFYTMPEFLVNLNTSGKQTSFLKTTVILEVGSAQDVPAIESNLPRLMDAFNTYLRELRSSDLAGSAGIQRLREELLLRANKALSPVKINDVLFKEIVVQ